MKVFFGYNITEDKDNETFDGDVFVIKEVPETHEKAVDDNVKNVISFIKLAEIPLAIRILQAVCSFIFIAGIAGIIKALENTSLPQQYENAPVLFYVLIIAALTWVVLAIYSYFKNKNISEGKDFTDAVSEAEEFVEASYAILGVPKDAFDMDVLITNYSVKNDKLVLKFDKFTQFINIDVKAFMQDGALFFADTRRKYSIPLTSLGDIRTIKKRTSVPLWNKDVPYNDEKYKPYKITENNYGHIFFKPYYALSINHEGEEYELYFPPYELPIIERLTGKRVIE